MELILRKPEMAQWVETMLDTDILNQKTERYTEARIKAAANENFKDKIIERKYFVFE